MIIPSSYLVSCSCMLPPLPLLLRRIEGGAGEPADDDGSLRNYAWLAARAAIALVWAKQLEKVETASIRKRKARERVAYNSAELIL